MWVAHVSTHYLIGKKLWCSLECMRECVWEFVMLIMCPLLLFGHICKYAHKPPQWCKKWATPTIVFQDTPPFQFGCVILQILLNEKANKGENMQQGALVVIPPLLPAATSLKYAQFMVYNLYPYHQPPATKSQHPKCKKFTCGEGRRVLLYGHR